MTLGNQPDVDVRGWWLVKRPSHLELLQLVLGVNRQGGIHGLILVDEVFESEKEADA